MAATVDDISGWFDEAVKRGATHMVVMCDTFSYDDYPVYVMPGTDVTEFVHGRKGVPGKEDIVGKDGNNMQSLMEVYAMHLDKDMQLNKEKRARHYEYPTNSGGSSEGAKGGREQAGSNQGSAGGDPG